MASSIYNYSSKCIVDTFSWISWDLSLQISNAFGRMNIQEDQVKIEEPTRNIGQKDLKGTVN